MVFELVPLMLEKVGIIVIVAFLLSQIRPFRQVLQNEQKINEKIMLIILFGAFGIISNITGIKVHDSGVLTGWISAVESDNAIANTRVMGIVIGGLFGGPVVGIGAALIAGIHRYFLGGYTALACSIAVVLAGVVAGYLGRKQMKRRKRITAGYAVMIGMTLELIQMLIILVVAKPFEQALNLVKMIGVPMILLNGFGMMLFMFIIQSILRDEKRTRASQTSQAFYIADRTLPFFRQGLNPNSCKKISEIMLKLTDADAVSITDDRHVLSHVGAGSDHHIPQGNLATGLTKKALESGEIAITKLKENIYCFNENCPLEAAIVIPLKVQSKTVGTLKMYFTNPEKLDEVQKELAEGLANLFSTQLELAEAEKQTRLLKDAKIKALQAQVHPHFLFNSLNTISILCRTDAGKARKLLLELSSFFRGNLHGASQLLVPLQNEIENVQAYLSLEQTRFPDKYHVELQVEPGLENALIPPFILQPLVENAINYGFTRSKAKGEITIQISSDVDSIRIIVTDNGNGIPTEVLGIIGKQTITSTNGTGTAIFNINERLQGIYNGQASFEITSDAGNGTTITISMPLERKGELKQSVKSVFG